MLTEKLLLGGGGTEEAAARARALFGTCTGKRPVAPGKHPKVTVEGEERSGGRRIISSLSAGKL